MRLILHAGTHKTGTSTLQRVLHEQASRLRGHGLFYPDPQRTFGGTYHGHHPLAHAVAAGGEALARARSFLRDVREGACDDELVLLSAEPVYRHVLGDHGGWWSRHREYLRALSRELVAAGFEPEALLVFRRRDGFAESLYHERVSQGFPHDLGHLVERGDRLLDYDRQVDLFKEAFSRVHCLKYEELAATDLVPAFLRALGVAPPELPLRPWERRSVDGRLTLWMAAAYRDDPDETLVTQRRRFAKSLVSDELFEDYGQVTLWADVEERRRLLQAYGDHDPIDDPRAPATLTAEMESRIDDAFDAYLAGKGLEPTGRSSGTRD